MKTHLLTDEQIKILAERIVENTKSNNESIAYDFCPCCGDCGGGHGDKESLVRLVEDMLRKGVFLDG